MSIKHSAVLLSVLTFSQCVYTLAASNYDDIDKCIVDAYNANPKRGAEVYSRSMEMIEKSRRGGGENCDEWRSKAENMITLSCFYETTQAIQNNDYMAAYVWAQRGLSNGASRGEIGGINIKEVHDFLSNAAKELENYEAVKKASFGKTKMLIANYRKEPPATKPEDSKPPIAAPAIVPPEYQLVAGPQTDAQGLMHVVVRIKGSDIKIFHYPVKGWKADTWQPFAAETYYKSWQEAAERHAGVKPGENK